MALYGHPGAPALGALGQQGLQASIARARHAAAEYRALSRVPVIPAFEIIATVAQARPGRDGDYSYQSTVASLRPWVRRAAAAGMHVILDLREPGRADACSPARAAPAGVFFGWKDFYAKDHPMMNAPQTMTRTPLLSMISYQ